MEEYGLLALAGFLLVVMVVITELRFRATQQQAKDRVAERARKGTPERGTEDREPPHG
jgi:hypothetical protein